MSDRLAEAAGILLMGAGHANLLALPILRRALPDARITLVDPVPSAIYSGMFPGFVAGHYQADDLFVDLAQFTARHGAELIRGGVIGIDPARHMVRLALADGLRTLTFDAAALDIGSHSAMPDIPGFAEHAVAVKPLGSFADRFIVFADQTPDDGAVAVIGGGIAGAEIALALAHRLMGKVALIEAGPRIAPGVTLRTRERLITALRRAEVRIVTGDPVTRILGDAVLLKSGQRIDSRLTIGVAGARAHDWLSRDLPTDEAGFVTVTPTLQVSGWLSLFAAGDCASMPHAPRPKAGVFAVRQGPILARNMVAMLRGGELRNYKPQQDYLKIVSLGAQVAVAEWYGLTLRGRWLWRWKDRIDRAFMRRLKE